jgi:hypothetical protein
MSVRGQSLNSAANTPDMVRRRMQGLQYPRSLERLQIHRKPPRRC